MTTRPATGRWRKLVALATIAIVCAGCTSNEPSPEEAIPHRPRSSPTSPDALVVGLVGTMSGPESGRGNDAFEGADVGIQALNRDRREGELAFELVTLDDKGEPGRAVALVRQLLTNEKSVGVVYAGPPEGLARSAGMLAEAGVPGVLCYGDLYTPNLLRGPLFQVSPPLGWEARELMTYLAHDRHYRTIGALVDESLDGTTAARSLRAVRPPGVELIIETVAPAGDTRDALGRIKKARVESVVVFGAPTRLSEVAGELSAMGATYESTPKARIASAPVDVRRRRRDSGYWHPQMAGFDLALEPLPPQDIPPPGTVVAESYGRGAHYLPLPSLETFRDQFRSWWGVDPLGREQRAYDAVRLIGAAARIGEPVASALEQMDRVRFGGLDLDLGADDHLAVQDRSVGLWVVPGPDAGSRERGGVPLNLPWVPLARSWAQNGRTEISPIDWRYLFESAPEPGDRPPRFSRQIYGVTTPARDPLH